MGGGVEKGGERGWEGGFGGEVKAHGAGGVVARKSLQGGVPNACLGEFGWARGFGLKLGSGFRPLGLRF